MTQYKSSEPGTCEVFPTIFTNTSRPSIPGPSPTSQFPPNLPFPTSHNHHCSACRPSSLSQPYNHYQSYCHYPISPPNIVDNSLHNRGRKSTSVCLIVPLPLPPADFHYTLEVLLRGCIGTASEEKHGGTRSTVRTVKLDSFEARIGVLAIMYLHVGSLPRTRKN